PTPVVGLVGRLPDAACAGRLGFAAAGDVVAVIGACDPSLRGSALAKLRGEAPAGPLAPIDGPAVWETHAQVRELVRTGAVNSAHDIAEGGIAVALAECCIAGGLGATVELPGDLEQLFGEAPGRAFVVSGPPEALAGFRLIGQVGGTDLNIAGQLKLAVSELRA